MEVARAYADALLARDYEAAEALLDLDVEVVPPSGRPYGLEGLRRSWTGDGFDHLDVALEEQGLAPDGDAAVARALQVFRWKEDGSIAHVRPLRTRFEVRGDRIVRILVEVEHQGERDG